MEVIPLQERNLQLLPFLSLLVDSFYSIGRSILVIGFRFREIIVVNRYGALASS